MIVISPSTPSSFCFIQESSDWSNFFHYIPFLFIEMLPFPFFDDVFREAQVEAAEAAAAARQLEDRGNRGGAHEGSGMG